MQVAGMHVYYPIVLLAAAAMSGATAACKTRSRERAP